MLTDPWLTATRATLPEPQTTASNSATLSWLTALSNPLLHALRKESDDTKTEIKMTSARMECMALFSGPPH